MEQFSAKDSPKPDGKLRRFRPKSQQLPSSAPAAAGNPEDAMTPQSLSDMSGTNILSNTVLKKKMRDFWRNKFGRDTLQTKLPDIDTRSNSQIEEMAADTNFTPDDVIVVLMGPTGSGKSSFINMATGKEGGVGHALESCTQGIHVLRYRNEESDINIVLVDTPGFDDTYKSDVEILSEVAGWLKKTYENKVMVAGILYLHRISDNRMAGTPLKNLQVFQELCGKNALKNIVLVTTMWDDVEESTGAAREDELTKEYWNDMIRLGSRTARYHNTVNSAWDILKVFLAEARKRHATLLQQELVDMHKRLGQSHAGRKLYGELGELVRRQETILAQLRDASETSSGLNAATLQQLKEQSEEVQVQLQETMAEMQRLNVPLASRLKYFIAARLKWS